VPSIKSENLYGQSFAKATGQAINKEFNGGFNLPVHRRYLSQNASEHGKFNYRRIRNQDEPADIRDNVDQVNFNDAE
jgi:hypothetical protein